MQYPNIALCGCLRSGKDVSAAYLRDNYGYTRFAFGDELKRDFHRRYPEIPREPKPRKGYQTHGQLMRELVAEDIWVRSAFDLIDVCETEAMYDNEEFRAVISDLRQPNEYARCRSEGYAIIRVNAPSALRIHRAVTSADTFNLADLTHETESHVDTFAADYDVYNVGTLDELYAQIDGIMTALGVDKT